MPTVPEINGPDQDSSKINQGNGSALVKPTPDSRQVIEPVVSGKDSSCDPHEKESDPTIPFFTMEQMARSVFDFLRENLSDIRKGAFTFEGMSVSRSKQGSGFEITIPNPRPYLTMPLLNYSIMFYSAGVVYPDTRKEWDLNDNEFCISVCRTGTFRSISGTWTDTTLRILINDDDDQAHEMRQFFLVRNRYAGSLDRICEDNHLLNEIMGPLVEALRKARISRLHETTKGDIEEKL